MFSIIGADGKEYGPVAVERIREWIAGGRANLQTQARRASETDWRTLGDFSEFSPPPFEPSGSSAAFVPPPVPATNAGGITLDLSRVNARTYANELIARARPLDPTACISQSIKLWTSNFWPLIGATTVSLVMATALSAIPLLGTLATLFLTGVFYGGLFYYYLGKMRGQPREFGDIFAGFSKAFGPLALCNAIVTLLTMLIAAVFIVPWVVGLIWRYRDGIPSFPDVPVIVGIAVCTLPLLYISVAWAFSFVLVIDKGLSPWTALEVSRRVVSKQWFRVAATLVLGWLLAALGLIGFFIGIFLTLPLAVGAILYAYEDLCNPSP